MSLKVWLPLNGDLHNQGISNSNINLVSGNTWASSGKIGNNSLTLTKLQTILPTSSCMTGAKEISYCYWVKVNTAWSTQWLDGIRWIETNGSTTSTARQEFYTNCTLVGTWYKGGSISGKAFTPGVWTHLAATFNYNTGEANFYIDGILKETTTNIDKTYYCRGDFYIGDNGVDICQNDVRIYDHCLSAAEVKEISQGLVLHYKLDDTYAETTTNLYSGTFSNTCYNGATNKYSYGTTTDMYKTTGNFQGKESVKVYMGTAGLSAYPYVYFDAFNTTGTAVHTLSFDYYPTSQTSIIPYSYNGSYNISYITSNGAHDSKTNISSITIPVVINQWNHIAITMQKYDTTNTSRGNGYIRIGSASHTSTTSDYWLFANIQVEAKDHETGYTAPGTTRSNVQIQDSSGYNYNGTITGNPSIISNTPRYSFGMHLGKTRINSSTGFPSGDNPNFTVAFWTKIFSNITYVSYGDLCGMYDAGQGSNTFRLELCGSPTGNNLMWFRGPSGRSGGGFNMNSASTAGWFTKDVWHHIALVGDGTNNKYYCYLDGVKCQTYNAGSNIWEPTGQFYIGDTVEATADFSDCRIYCTALLDADIKRLYEISMEIDSSGNILPRILST